MSQQDFTDNPNRTYPTSCCAPDITEQISISHRPLASAVVFRTDDNFRERNLNISEMADVAWNHVIPKDASRSFNAVNLNSENKIIATCRAVYTQVSIIYTVALCYTKTRDKKGVDVMNLLSGCSTITFFYTRRTMGNCRKYLWKSSSIKSTWC